MGLQSRRVQAQEDRRPERPRTCPWRRWKSACRRSAAAQPARSGGHEPATTTCWKSTDDPTLRSAEPSTTSSANAATSGVLSSPRSRPRTRRLLFTNAGMNQFKGVFLQEETARLPPGGHHPEMHARLGQAQRPRRGRPDRLSPHLLRDAGQLLLRRLLQGEGHRLRLGAADRGIFDLPPERLWITVFRDDDEAFRIWQERDRRADGRASIRLGEKDNFWQMGDTGPCGPCSEIHYDRGPSIESGGPDSSSRRQRPLRRDLEPGLHAVQPRRRRRPAAPARAVHRHGHGPGAPHRRPAGRGQQLRDRPVHADHRAARRSWPGVDRGDDAGQV